MTQLNGHVYTCACGGRWSASTVVRGGTLDEVTRAGHASHAGVPFDVGYLRAVTRVSPATERCCRGCNSQRGGKSKNTRIIINIYVSGHYSSSPAR